jgi:hypothetical protein
MFLKTIFCLVGTYDGGKNFVVLYLSFCLHGEVYHGSGAWHTVYLCCSKTQGAHEEQMLKTGDLLYKAR